MMPAIDANTGKALLNAPDSLALSPNGHGGSLKALYTSGAIADMKDRGVEHLSYFQVDNPNVHCVDPLFLGLHAMDESQMSSKMLEKAYPKEKLGNFCKVGGRVTVIEYSDLPDELAEARLPDGELKFRAGSIAIHALRVDFIESLNTSTEGFSLPFHRADKKVAYIDNDGKLHNPAEPNAVKLETFVFDALPLCDAAIILETDRVEEFAPIKNADTPAGEDDAVDSPATSKQLQTERAARWLKAKGVTVAANDDGWADATIELTPLAAVEPDDLDDAKLPETITSGSDVLLDS
jgi:UDP-N-acetylglucosamine/UDP-N-acetylgalactosamine diphosphorylase